MCAKRESGNPNGRAKGSENKTTKQLLDIFLEILAKKIDTVQSDYDCNHQKERLFLIEKVAKLVLPPPQPDVLRLSEEDFPRLI